MTIDDMKNVDVRTGVFTGTLSSLPGHYKKSLDIAGCHGDIVMGTKY